MRMRSPDEGPRATQFHYAGMLDEYLYVHITSSALTMTDSWTRADPPHWTRQNDEIKTARFRYLLVDSCAYTSGKRTLLIWQTNTRIDLLGKREYV